MNAWIENIRELTVCKKWREILSLEENITLAEKSRILWVWPTERNLIFLRNIFDNIQTYGILSVGCGSGLLEWILQESIGIPTAGIELGNSWWSSNYCPKPFIKLNFVESQVTSRFLQQCIGRDDWQFSLLFCYFNNRCAFLEYLKAYKGSCLIIIGPEEGGDKHTDPSPFQLGSDLEDIWHLHNSCEVGKTGDFIAVYFKHYF